MILSDSKSLQRIAAVVIAALAVTLLLLGSNSGTVPKASASDYNLPSSCRFVRDYDRGRFTHEYIYTCAHRARHRHCHYVRENRRSHEYVYSCSSRMRRR